MSIEQEAAQELAARAMQAERQSEAYLLIDTAKSLDPSTKAGELKSRWLENWLIQNKNRTGEPSHDSKPDTPQSCQST